jgi:DNA polymerase-3 subunit beta
MNFIVSSASLLKQLSLISGVLNSSNTLPILDNFLFETSGSDLSILASDLETTMSTKLTVESKEDGVVAIPAKMLIDILKNLSDHPITFSIDKGNHSVEISSDYGKYKLSGYAGDEFPKVPEIDQSSSLTVASSVLLRAISKTIFAAGNDDLRPVMSGVYCELGTDDITFVATDAHKLVRYKRLDAKSEKTTSFILPSKPLNLLKHCLNSAEEVVVEYNQNNAFFSLGNINLICRLVEGKYPNYDAVIPKENPNVLTIDRSLLLSSVKRVSIFANKTTHQVKLKLAGSSLNISAEDLDFANKADERLTCSYSGEDMEIGFNSKFLMEMLNNIDTDEITIEMSEPNRAGIILPGNKEDENEDMLMLVMPVMLN